MTQYRLYYRTDQNVSIRGFEPLEADSDAAAINGAEARQRTLGVELWCANRLVKRWDLVQPAELGQSDDVQAFRIVSEVTSDRMT